MGSRLRENPRRLLECWCEVVGPRGSDNPPWIIQKFPNNYNNEEILKSVPQFAFPCTFSSTNVQHFSFVLTDVDSKWTYGFCRHAPSAETALVLLSHLPWHETFYKLLNTISEMMSAGRTSDMKSCLQSVYKFKVPPPGTEITVPYGDNKFFVAQCPNHLKLPTIPENRNLSEYFNAVDANNMMIIFASMLYERRIIMVSKKLSRLSACVQAANSVIYPMQWQHIFIPVLPQHLLEYLLAPMPFLIGVNTALMSKIHRDEIGDAVILDADNNTVETPFNDVETLPDEVVAGLKRNLKSPNHMLGDCVARAFLRALVQLIGNYKEALQFREEDSKITFNRDKFVSIRPHHFQPFVEKMLELQIFQQFIEERLDGLNSGKQTSDEFELEVSVHCEKSSSKVKQQYKQFVTNVRKEGGAIMKTVKSKSPLRLLKTNTVAKGGKQVREKGRQTVKDIRGKLKDFQQPRLDDGSMSPTWINGDSPTNPRSAPSSPVLGVKRRPQTVSQHLPQMSAKATYKRSSQGAGRDDSSILPGTRKYDALDSSGVRSPGSNDSASTPSPQSMDLMGEMEMIFKFGQEGEGERGRHVSGGGKAANGPTQGYATLQHPAKDTSLAAKKDGQDLIFLESQEEEIFDPLFTKDVPRTPARPTQPPPPVPGSARSSSSLPSGSVTGGSVGSLSTSCLPDQPSLARTSAINITGLPTATPQRPSTYQSLGPEYRPFSSLQTSLGTPVGCQNPMYNQHKPPGTAPSATPPLPNTTRSGSAGVAFASSLLGEAQRSPRAGQYVQFEPPLTRPHTPPTRPQRLTQRDLLGDFEKGFQTLSVNTKGVGLGNNNSTVVNNNKVTEYKNDSKSDSKTSQASSDSKWATFE